MIRLCFIFLLFSFNSLAQLKTGTYIENSDTVYIGKARIVYFSQLELNEDKTFIYHHRTSEGCLLWFDIKGSWYTGGNKLALADTALFESFKGDRKMLPRITTYTIKNDKLIYHVSVFNQEADGYYPLRYISGNFIFKKD